MACEYLWGHVQSPWTGGVSVHCLWRNELGWRILTEKFCFGSGHWQGGYALIFIPKRQISSLKTGRRIQWANEWIAPLNGDCTQRSYETHNRSLNIEIWWKWWKSCVNHIFEMSSLSFSVKDKRTILLRWLISGCSLLSIPVKLMELQRRCVARKKVGTREEKAA